MHLSPSRLRLLVVALLSVSFLGALDHTVVSTSLATIAGELGALEQIGWVVVAYTLASTVLLPVLGKLGDVVGPRAVFHGSLVVFLVASMLCGFANDMALLIAARALQGASSAGLQLMSQTIVARVTTPRERPKYMALIGAAFPVAILVGPVVGGVLTDYWGWPWVFWINLPVGVVALILAVVAVPHLDGGERRAFDVAGAVAFTAALTAVVLAVTWLPDPSNRTAALVATAAAIVLLVVLLVVEARADEPILPVRYFADRTVAAGTALSAIIGIGLFSITAYLPTYFQMAYRTSVTVSGLVPIATVFGMLTSNLLTGFLASRTGHYRVYPIVGTILGAAGLLQMALLPAGLPLGVPMLVMAGVGLGTGSFMSLIVTVVQSAAPPTEVGAVTATVNIVRQVGSTVTTAVIGAIVGVGVAALLPVGIDAATLTPQFVHAASPAVQEQIAAIYRDVFAPVFIALAATYGVGIVAALLLPRRTLSAEYDIVPEPDPVTA
ncbi:MFS transporter [Microbacterium sp.]|uniref:MFS transporter n=1 Tax=Microbacterium sp. TaxID=51671 RepID=UPI0039E5AF13